MAKKSESLDYQKLISEICSILQVEESNVIEAVKSYAQAARRPVVAATIMIDPILSEPKISFIKNNGEVAFLEAEYALNSAMDFVKALKAQEMVKKQSEEKKDS